MQYAGLVMDQFDGFLVSGLPPFYKVFSITLRSFVIVSEDFQNFVFFPKLNFGDWSYSQGSIKQVSDWSSPQMSTKQL